MRKHFALMATVAALAVTPALAQTTAPQSGQPATQAQPSTQSPSSSTTMAPSNQAMKGQQFVDMQASGQWLVSDLMGLNVVGSNNESIGEVSDLLIDEGGNILAAVVGVGGFLGIGQKDVAISFDAFDITRDKDGDPQGRLSLTKDQLEKAPAFKTADTRAGAQRPSTPATSPATKPAAPRN